MRLPFTAGQFFAVCLQYNEAVWPAQLLLNALALLCVVAVLWPRPWTDMRFSLQRRGRALTGAGFVVYALIAYPPVVL